ncbi:major facilitator superfamily domain-containing protein, partial [Scenedesmus sp. NREL 46B-D3]
MLLNHCRVVCRVNIVILPLLFFAGVFAYLDKGNLNYAAIELNLHLGLNAVDFGLASGMFYIGFGVGIIPLTFVSMRYGTRYTLGAMTLAWGIISTCQAAVSSRSAFFALRLLLGLAEGAGPSSAGHLLAQFYPQSKIALPFTVVVVSSTVSGIFAAPLAAGLMRMGDIGGLAGWQYLFIIEGVPSVLLGLAIMVWLPSTPLTAWMLSAEERELLHKKVHGSAEAADAARAPPRWRQLLWLIYDALRRPLLWFFIAVGFLWVVSAMGTNSWLTVIINNMLSGTALTNSTSSGVSPAAAKAAAGAKHARAQSTHAILLSGIPAFCASIAMVLTAWHADRVDEKNWHVAVPYLIGGVALTLFTPLYTALFIAGFITLVLALTFANAAMGVINARVVAALETKHTGIGLALYTAILACLGGFSGPVIIGTMVQQLGSFSQATIAMGAILCSAGLLMAGLAVGGKWGLKK